ncbi:MAG: hypothetical protein ACJ8HQ_12800 [Chthoniobacterales bacterium]
MPNNSSILSRVLPFIPFGEIFRRPPPPLIDRGFGLIYDSERDITWLQDVNYAQTVRHSRDGQMTWPEAMAWVHSLDYRGVRGWRLPNARNPDGSGPVTGNNAVGSELGHLYLDVFANHPGIVALKNGKVPCIFWTGTEANAEEAYAFDLFTLRQGSLWKDPFAERFPNVPLSGPVLTWPVHDGDVAAELRSRWLQQLLASILSLFRR